MSGLWKYRGPGEGLSFVGGESYTYVQRKEYSQIASQIAGLFGG
jgi:hypothetical protein